MGVGSLQRKVWVLAAVAAVVTLAVAAAGGFLDGRVTGSETGPGKGSFTGPGAAQMSPAPSTGTAASAGSGTSGSGTSDSGTSGSGTSGSGTSGSGTSGRAGTASGPSGAYRLAVVSGESEALYRVREQLAGISFPVDAVGRTRQVSGAVVFDEEGRVIPELSEVRVNLASLQSDQSRRDNFVRQNTLQTSRYPDAVLVPTEVRGLTFPLPQEGSAPVTIVADLTIRNVTRQVEWTGTAYFEPGAVRIEAGTSVTFADFDLQQPRTAAVLSVADTIRLEANVRMSVEQAG